MTDPRKPTTQEIMLERFGIEIETHIAIKLLDEMLGDAEGRFQQCKKNYNELAGLWKETEKKLGAAEHQSARRLKEWVMCFKKLEEEERLHLYTQKSLDVERDAAIITEVKLRDAEQRLKEVSGFADALKMNGTTERVGNELQAILEDK